MKKLLILSLLAGCIGLLGASSAHAAPVSGFDAGKIIDDNVFTNTSTMSPGQIQAFLNSKVPSCDTWGTQPSEFGGGTRRQWGEARGYYPPYTCLRDFSENGKSAAQIIYDVSIKYAINPQVMIVLLQKEQGLVTDTWPTSTQYRSATGYGCPDTAPCDAQYYGLTNQLDWAAKMFRAILNNSPTWYTPYNLGNNYIQYNPQSSCGGSNVNIQNRSTQALYNYTPYQPNQGALNAGWGTAPCGAYGNRNFYLYFTELFGSVRQVPIPGCAESTNTALVCVWKAKNNSTGSEMITADYNTIVSWVNGQGHTFIGKSFFGRTSSVDPAYGNVPIYSLTKPGSGATFLTADRNEYTSLRSSGFGDNGIIFYADPAGSNSGFQVYRLYNSSSGQHVWASDQAALNIYLNSGYVKEGTSFTGLSRQRQETAAPTGQGLVYRFGGMPGNTHFWTQDIGERDQMIVDGYSYEGVSMRVSQATTSIPVYRLYSPVIKQHLFTRDFNEANVLGASGNWNYEGVAWHAVASGTPVFRLYSPTTYEHLYTADVNEKNFWVSRGLMIDEGIGWYQP